MNCPICDDWADVDSTGAVIYAVCEHCGWYGVIGPKGPGAQVVT